MEPINEHGTFVLAHRGKQRSPSRYYFATILSLTNAELERATCLVLSGRSRSNVGPPSPEMDEIHRFLAEGASMAKRKPLKKVELDSEKDHFKALVSFLSI